MHPGLVADLSHVLARWHADEQYVDADGRPVPLPLEGPEPSLKGLVSRVLPSIAPAQATQWLTKLKGIRLEGRRFLPTDKYLAFNRLPVAAWAHGLAAVREEARRKGEPVTRLCIGLYAFEDPLATGGGPGPNRPRRTPGKRRPAGRRR